MHPHSFSVPLKLHYVHLENETEEDKISVENKAAYFFTDEVTSTQPSYTKYYESQMSITPFLYSSITGDQASQLTFVILSVPPCKCYEYT
jgi:hypothetical protein